MEKLILNNIMRIIKNRKGVVILAIQELLRVRKNWLIDYLQNQNLYYINSEELDHIDFLINTNLEDDDICELNNYIDTYLNEDDIKSIEKILGKSANISYVQTFSLNLWFNFNITRDKIEDINRKLLLNGLSQNQVDVFESINSKNRIIMKLYLLNLNIKDLKKCLTLVSNEVLL